MTQWTHLCRAIGLAILVAISNARSPAEPKAPGEGARTASNTEPESKTNTPNETSADLTKVVGKGVYTLEQIDAKPEFRLVYPVLWREAEVSSHLQFARMNPDSELADDILLRAAEILVNEKKYDQALKILDAIIERYPNSAQVHRNVFTGLVLKLPYTQCEVETNRKALFDHIREHPDFTADEALRLKALLYNSLGKTGEAVEVLQQYVDGHPRGRWAEEDTRALSRLGSFRMYRKDELIFHHLAWLYYRRGDYGEAESILIQAIKNFVGSPYTVAYYDLLARIHEKTGDAVKEVDALTHRWELSKRKEHVWVGVAGTLDRETLPECEHWRLLLLVRPPEKVDSRLRELKAIEGGRAKDGTQQRPKAEAPGEP